MLIECPLGSRLSACATCWEWCCKQVLGEDSINLEKRCLEGHWSQHQTLLGFEFNTDEMAIRLPEEKAEQARSLILSPELSPGNYAISIKTLQHLRGMCVRWMTCNLFWHCLCQPIDLLLAHASESGTMVCCGEVEIWMSMFNALTLARPLARSDSDWKLLFQCSLERLQVMHQRLSGTMENQNEVWTSGDATLTRIAGVSRKAKEYFHTSPEELLKDFHQRDGREYQIAEVELITSVGIVVLWGDIWNVEQIILLCADNQNTFSWLDNKIAKKGLALRIVATFHLWCVKNGIEVYPFYLGSLRNIRPDFI